MLSDHHQTRQRMATKFCIKPTSILGLKKSARSAAAAAVRRLPGRQPGVDLHGIESGVSHSVLETDLPVCWLTLNRSVWPKGKQFPRNFTPISGIFSNIWAKYASRLRARQCRLDKAHADMAAGTGKVLLGL